ncbi:MAG: NUDIX hydrolase [Gammaproteobacteria bacterium]|nr:NUDIX hydrolase [Gammaproteobacteria bacterium]
MVWKPHVTVAAVIEDNGRFLLVEENSDGENVFNQPAGHLEQGENLTQAVIRETLEETAWKFLPKALIGIYRWPHPLKSITYIRFAFTGELLEREQDRLLDDGIIRTVWMTPDEIRACQSMHRSPQVMQCVDDYLAGQRAPLSILKELS